MISAGRSLGVLSPGEPVHMSWAAGSEVFGLRADSHAMQVALKAIAPHADDRPLRFSAPALDIHSAVAVYGAARLLADVFSQYGPAEQVSHRIIQLLADQVMNAVLLAWTTVIATRSGDAPGRTARSASPQRSNSSTPKPAPRTPSRTIRWENEYGWTRGGYGQVAEKETSLADVLARLLSTPDMWRTSTESYLKALEAVGRGEPKKSRTSYGSFNDTSYRREQRADDLAAWHEMLLDRFAGTPEDELLDQFVASHGLGGPEPTFLQAKLAERRGDRAQAAALTALCLEKLPGHTGFLDLALEVGADLPSRARAAAVDRALAAKYPGRA